MRRTSTRHICDEHKQPDRLPRPLTDTLRYPPMPCELRFAGRFPSQQVGRRNATNQHATHLRQLKTARSTVTLRSWHPNLFPNSLWTSVFHSQQVWQQNATNRHTTHLRRAQMATPPHWHPNILPNALWTFVCRTFSSSSTGLATKRDKPAHDTSATRANSQFDGYATSLTHHISSNALFTGFLFSRQ